MRSRLPLVLVALVSTACSVLVDSFAVPPHPIVTAHRTRSRSIGLNLVPEQGKQLVAAFTAASVKKEAAATNTSVVIHDDDKKPGVALVLSSIFSIPGALLGRHPAAALVDLPREQLPRDSRHEDVVLYPMVGFRYVKGATGMSCNVLPTISKPACQLLHVPDQELYGWYTRACPLDNIYSDTYCNEPQQTLMESKPNDETDDKQKPVKSKVTA